MTETPKQAAKRLSGPMLNKGFKPAGLHTYTDTQGEPLYWRIRAKHPDTGEKWIRPMKFNGAGFELGEPNFENGKPLYALHRIASNPDAAVWIVEGEGKADALNKLGLVASTSGGATSADGADWQPLRNRTVNIWPDNDDPGKAYAGEVANILLGMGCNVSSVDVDKLGLGKGEDVMEWLEAHPGAAGGDIEALPMLSPVKENASTGDCGAAQQSDDEVIRRLATLKPLEYDKVRVAQAKALGIRPATLDAEVKAIRADGSEADRLPFAEVEPHPEPINPAQLLSEVSDTIRRFIVLDTEQAHAAALWVAFTWFVDVVEVAPLAIISAPEKSCGKSQLLTLLGRLVCRPLMASNMRGATLFRIAEKWHPAILIDEADTFIKTDDDMAGLINAGYTRDAAFAWRLVGDNFEPKAFNVWGAKAFAGIALEKHLPDATMSRAIVFELRRKLASEKVIRLRDAELGLFEGIASKLARFAADYSHQVRLARPALPDKLSDRAQDNWHPLLAIAECAGAEWVTRATAAAVKLSGAGGQTVSTGNELLADIQHVFESKGVDKISTADLIAALLADDEKSWATYNRGKPISAKQIANRLKEYGIRSKSIRLGYEVSRGFEISHFKDAFARYLTPPDLPILSATPLQTSPGAALSVADRKSVTVTQTASATPQPAPQLGCNTVADKKPIFGGAEASRPNASHLRI